MTLAIPRCARCVRRQPAWSSSRHSHIVAVIVVAVDVIHQIAVKDDNAVRSDGRYSRSSHRIAVTSADTLSAITRHRAQTIPAAVSHRSRRRLCRSPRPFRHRMVFKRNRRQCTSLCASLAAAGRRGIGCKRLLQRPTAVQKEHRQQQLDDVANRISFK